MVNIDINCDLGEGCSNDEALMKLISSANIACGSHAGDAETMAVTVGYAVREGVAIGAHPGYRDRENFGRTAMNLSSDEIYAIVSAQVAALQNIAHAAGATVSHVKPHGALYNQSARDAMIAKAIARAVFDFDSKLILFGLSGSLSITEAEAIGLKTASEVFADRTYQADGSLTPRSEQNALIIDTEVAVAQALQMVTDGAVTAVDGSTVAIKADTICIHGDGPNAISFARAIHDELNRNGITIKARRSR